MGMRPTSSSREERPGPARAREHASTYYCKPSYCTAVLPPGLPRRPGPRWEGACRSACGSAGRPRSPWCSRPKPTTSSNHLGEIQKSPVSLSESPGSRGNAGLANPAVYQLPGPETGVSLKVVELDTSVAQKVKKRKGEASPAFTLTSLQLFLFPEFKKWLDNTFRHMVGFLGLFWAEPGVGLQ